MAWKGLHLSRPAYLHTERGSLSIEFRDGLEPEKFRLPLEDVAWIVMDTPQISMNSSFLARCSEEGVLLLGVDERHLPTWTSLPWTRFHRHGEILKLQLDSTLPLRKRLWQEIVRLKLAAQAASLTILGLPKSPHLAALIQAVRSGDPDNVEARAAALYFKELLPCRPFTRHSDDLPNHLLDYGYAIIRAAIARQLCAIGFIPQLGLHHCSLSNAYNLADDMIEPYRPFVDVLMVKVLDGRDSTAAFQVEDRRQLVSLLDREVLMNGETHTLFNAITLSVASLKTALKTENPKALIFPALTS
jgi:CRISP-associated protein Cas1